MDEDQEKYFISLLLEALGELSELSNRIHELEKGLKSFPVIILNLIT